MARGSKLPRNENDDLDGEIDASHKQRDVDDDVDMNDDEEHPVLGIEDPADDDSDEDKNDEHDDDNAKYDDKEIAKMKRRAKCLEQIAGGKVDLSDDAEPEKESQAVRGNKRDIYYERGGKEHKSSDEEKSKVEEALRLLKKRLHFLRMDDLDLPSKSDRGQDEERTSQLRTMLDLLVHASQCRFQHCRYPKCLKVKGLFRHGIHCKTRAAGGCTLCKKMWYLLQLHARACEASDCRVPRCKDLKEYLKMLQHYELRKMLDLLVHASQCRFPHCRYPKCLKVKRLFCHGIRCKTGATGGCTLCNKMWYLLQLHARACEASGCRVPGRKDLKEHLKMLQLYSDSRRGDGDDETSCREQ